jgi:hypothetical protein
MLGIRSWWSTAMNREEWRRFLREARTLTEFRANDDDDDNYGEVGARLNNI